MKKLGIFLLNTFGILILLSLLLWTGLLIAKCVLYRDYMQNGEDACTIPDIHSGFVPQGLTNVGDSAYLFTGYHGKTGELCMYYTQNGASKQVIPVDESGAVLKNHGGGVAQAGDYVYVANDAKLTVFRLSEIQSAADGATVTTVGSFAVDNEASFCFADADRIYVGEFYRPEVYPTDPSHKLVTPAGEEHHALVSCYALNADGTIADNYPLYSISVTSQVQGFAVKDNTFILSRSWGVSNSKLEFYNGLVDTGATIDVSGKEVPLYFLESSNLKRTVDMPAFSEDLTVIGDRVYVNFESACNKYIIGKLFFADQVISYPIPTFE